MGSQGEPQVVKAGAKSCSFLWLSFTGGVLGLAVTTALSKVHPQTGTLVVLPLI